jgi:hypothetical protein
MTTDKHLTGSESINIKFYTLGGAEPEILRH